MRRGIALTVLAIVMILTQGVAVAADADVDGVTLGKWTMDLDAAKEIARKKNLPILLNFSGSDWCGWCKLMERSVFSKQEWQDYAKENILTVVIDFPKDSTIVPKKYVERNKELKDAYGVNGFPAFVVIDSDGKSELGRLGAGRGMTPATFIGKIKAVCRYSAACVEKYAGGLKRKDRDKYLRIVKQIAACEEDAKRSKSIISKEEEKIAELEEKAVALRSSAREFRAGQLGGEELKKFNELKDELDRAEKSLAEWLESKPERTDENTKKYQAMSKTIQEVSDKLSAY